MYGAIDVYQGVCSSRYRNGRRIEAVERGLFRMTNALPYALPLAVTG